MLRRIITPLVCGFLLVSFLALSVVFLGSRPSVNFDDDSRGISVPSSQDPAITDDGDLSKEKKNSTSGTDFLTSAADRENRPPHVTSAPKVWQLEKRDNRIERVASIEQVEHPYRNWRVEVLRDPATEKVLERRSMVADHLMVKPKPDFVGEFAGKIEQLGFKIRRGADALGWFLVELKSGDDPDAILQAKARLEEQTELIAAVEFDGVVTEASSPEDLLESGQLWGLRNTGLLGGTPGADIGVYAGWAIQPDAHDVVVAVLDSGISSTHRDLDGVLWVNENEISNGVDSDANGYVDDLHGIDLLRGFGFPEDTYGHGSHVAGIIAGNGDAHGGAVGIAPGVRLMPLRFLSGSNGGVISDAVTGILYAIENSADIINISWSTTYPSNALREALEAARDAGILIVAAAGNEAANLDHYSVYPAAYRLANVVIVGATDRNDQLAEFSNFGATSVHLLAPGKNILSAGIESTDFLENRSGTSMAAAHVSGLFAVLRSHHPADSTTELVNRLINGAERIEALAGVALSGSRASLPGALGAASGPTNNHIEAAFQSQLGQVVWSGNSRYASDDPAAPEALPESVWHRWSPSVGGAAKLRLDADFSAEFAIYEELSEGGLALLNSGGAGENSFTVNGGDSYLVAVAGAGGAAGDYRLSLSIPPENNLRGGAHIIDVFPGVYEATNLGANIATGEPPHANVASFQTVWWRWTASYSGSVQISTEGSDFDTVLAVYLSGPHDEYTEIAADDDDGLSHTSAVHFYADSGTTYDIVVGGYRDAAGQIQLSMAPGRQTYFTQHPKDVFITERKSFTLNSRVFGPQPLSYQWYKDGEPLPGARSRSFSASWAGVEMSGTYQLKVTSPGGSFWSETAEVVVDNLRTEITRQPTSQQLQEGADARFSVSVNPSRGATYQWYHDGVLIDGANAPELVLSGISQDDAGRYKVEVTYNGNVYTSEPALLSIQPAGSQNWIRANPEFTMGGSTAKWHGDYFFIYGEKALLAMSPDGRNWIEPSVPGAFSHSEDAIAFTGMLHAEGHYYIWGRRKYKENSFDRTGFETKIYRSADGMSWTEMENPHNLRGVTELNGVFVGRGQNIRGRYEWYATTDWVQWQSVGAFNHTRISFSDLGDEWEHIGPLRSGDDISNNGDSDWDVSTGPVIVPALEPGPDELPANTIILRKRFESPYDRGPGRFYVRARAHDGFRITVGAAPSSYLIRENVGSLYVTYSTPASELLEPDVASAVREFNPFPGYNDLVQGTNVITAWVHKATEGDSFSFDLDLDYERDYPSGDAVAGNGRLLILREDGVSFTSPDGLTWTRHDDTALALTYTEEIYVDSLTSINGEFLLRSKDGQKVFRSSDGINWDVDQVVWTGTVKYSWLRRLNNLQWDGSQYYSYSGGAYATIATSPDGIHWHIRNVENNQTSGDPVIPWFVVAGDPGVVAFGGNRPALIDSLDELDGNTLERSSSSYGVISKFRVLENDIIAYDHNNYLYHSTDGIDFRQVTNSHFSWDIGFTENFYYRLSFNSEMSTLTRFEAVDLPDYDLHNSPWVGRSEIDWPLNREPISYLSTETLHVAVGDQLGIATSANGFDWVDRSPESERGGSFTTVEQLPEGGFVAFGTVGLIYKSDDGLIWEDISIPEIANVTNVAQLGDVLVVSVFRSGDYGDPSEVFVRAGGTWSSQILADYGPIRGVSSGQGIFKAIADSHMFTSANGIDWQASVLPGGGARAIAFFEDRFIIGCESTGFRHFGATREIPLEPLSVVSPTEDQTVHTNDPVEINLDFGDSEIVSVKYFINAKLVAEQLNGPFSYQTLAGAPGNYRLSYVATAASGEQSKGAIRYTVEMDPWQTVSPKDWQNFHQVAELPGDRLIGVGGSRNGKALATVLDGGSWIEATLPSDVNLSTLHKLVVAEELNTMVALQTSNSATFAVSQGGRKWDTRSVSLPPFEGNLQHSAYGNGVFLLMASGRPSCVVVSSNGFDWTVVPYEEAIFPANLADLIYFDGRFLAITVEGELYESSNGQDWIYARQFGSGETIHFFQFQRVANQLIVTIPPTATVEPSAHDYWFTLDAETWGGGHSPASSPMATIAFKDGHYSAIFGTEVFQSDDILNWGSPLSDLAGTDSELSQPTLFYRDAQWCVFSISSRSCLESPDLLEWKASAEFVPNGGTHVIATDGSEILVAGMGGWLVRSTDGIKWYRQAPFTSENILALDYFGGRWIAFSESHTLFHSTDGLSWTSEDALGASTVSKTIQFNGRLFAIGSETVLSSEDGIQWQIKDNFLGGDVEQLLPEHSVIVNDRLIVFAKEVGSWNAIVWSTEDGINWQRSLNPESFATPINQTTTYHIIFDGSDYRLARSIDRDGDPSGGHYVSKDLVNWTSVSANIPQVFTPVVSSGAISISRQARYRGHLRVSLDNNQTWSFIPSSSLEEFIYAPHIRSFVGVSPFGEIHIFPLMDLAAVSGHWPEAVERGLGGTVDFGWTLRNDGLAAMDGVVSTQARFWLSETRQLGDGRRYLIGERFWEGALFPGNEKVFSETGLIASDLPPGNYYIVVSVYSNHADFNYRNNTLASPEPVVGIGSHVLYMDVSGSGDLFLMEDEDSAGTGERAYTVRSGQAFTRGAGISLYAQAKQGYAFTGWNDQPAGGDSVLRLVMDEDQYVTPIFTPLHSINVIQAEGGVIQIDTSETMALEGTLLSVRAIPDEGKRFLRWTGGLDGVSPELTFELDGPLELSAEFVDGIGFAEWAENRRGTGNTIDPQVDSSGNGWPNTLEFFLGMESEASHPPIYEIKNSEDFFTLRFQYDRAAIVGAFVVEASTDLTTWSEASVETLYSEGPGMSAIVEALVSKKGPKKFLRLKVVLPD